MVGNRDGGSLSELPEGERRWASGACILFLKGAFTAHPVSLLDCNSPRQHSWFPSPQGTLAFSSASTHLPMKKFARCKQAPARGEHWQPACCLHWAAECASWSGFLGPGSLCCRSLYQRQWMHLASSQKLKTRTQHPCGLALSLIPFVTLSGSRLLACTHLLTGTWGMDWLRRLDRTRAPVLSEAACL